MQILQINTADKGGGAEGSAYNLHKGLRNAGESSFMAVGTKLGDDPDVYEIPRECPPGLVNRMWMGMSNWLRKRQGRLPGARKGARILERLANPERLSEWRWGREEFSFPGCRKLLAALPFTPDIIHCHNLHGWYFDLRLLPQLSHRFPVILNLRDAWTLTGHCAYFMECRKWEDACGNCPRLNAYPPLRRNATTENWLRKQQIYQQSRLYVTAPSQWLVDEVRRSMLNAVQYKVIPNGIDTSVFKPGDRAAARACLGLPQDCRVVMFASASPRNEYKDPMAMETCIACLAERHPELHFLCVGVKPQGKLGAGKVPNLHRIPYISSPERMADCYRAANCFIHTARAEAFGKTVTEAMACGIPVAATRVGGIPEQIILGKTGALAPLGDGLALADEAWKLLQNASCMADDCARQGARFSLDAQVRNFLQWYQEVREDFAAAKA